MVVVGSKKQREKQIHGASLLWSAEGDHVLPPNALYRVGCRINDMSLSRHASRTGSMTARVTKDVTKSAGRISTYPFKLIMLPYVFS